MSKKRKVLLLVPITIAFLVTVVVAFFGYAVKEERQVVKVESSSSANVKVLQQGYLLTSSPDQFMQENGELVYVIENYKKDTDRIVVRNLEGTERSKDISRGIFYSLDYDLSPDGRKLLVATPDGILVSSQPDLLSFKVYIYPTISGDLLNINWLNDSQTVLLSTGVSNNLNGQQSICCTKSLFYTYNLQTNKFTQIGELSDFYNPQRLIAFDSASNVAYYQASNLHLEETFSINANTGKITQYASLSNNDVYSSAIFSKDYSKAYTLDTDSDSGGGDTPATRVTEITLLDDTKRTLFRFPGTHTTSEFNYIMGAYLELDDTEQNLYVSLPDFNMITYKANLATSSIETYQSMEWHKVSKLIPSTFWLVTNLEQYGLLDLSRQEILPMLDRGKYSRYQGINPSLKVIGYSTQE